MCSLMFALTFLAAGEVAIAQTPPIEKITYRVEIHRNGRWKLESEHRYKVPLEKRATYEAFFECFGEAISEMPHLDSRTEGYETLTFPDDEVAVATIHEESDDPAVLVSEVRQLFELERCTFSWSGDEFHIAGKHVHSGPGIAGVVLAVVDPSLEPYLAGKVPTELIVSSEVTIRTTGMPAKIDEDGHRMVMRMNDFDPAPDELWSFSVDGLGEK